MSEQQQTLGLQQTIDLAVQHHTAGRLSQAESIYQQILQSDPNQVDALHLLGVIAHQTGKNDLAVDLISKALTIKPDYAEAHSNLGLALQDLSKLEEAIASFQKALALKPEYVEAHYNLGIALKELGKLEEAVTSYHKALDLKPDHAKAHNNLGVALQGLGKLEEAVASCRAALALKPDFVEVHYNLGNMLKELGKLEESVASYHEALALKPDFADAHNNLGNALTGLGKLEEAVTSCRKALEFKPDYAEAHNNLGNALQNLGKLEAAVASYEKALAIKPDFADAYNNLGVALQELGKLEEAVARYNKALALKPHYADAHSNLGVALQGLGKLEEAVASYNKALALKPHYADAHSNLGIALAEQGNYQESVAAYQRSFASRTGIQSIGTEELSPATTVLFLELTNKCNFHCTFCPSDLQNRALGFMDLELAKRAYEEATKKKLVTQVALHLMGEPTLHPKLIDILNFGASKNVKTELVTNGSTLVAKVVPRILDALYGTIIASHMTPTKETYHFRGKVGLSWDRYIGNIRLLVREYMKRLANGKNTRNEINLRIMVTKDTASNVGITESEEQAHVILTEWIDFVSEIEQELGMPSFKRQEPHINDLFRGNLHPSTKHRLQQGIVLTFWRASTFANTRVSDDYDLKKTDETVFCPHPFKDIGVLWNGDVTLCCLDHDGQLKVGNIQDASIENVIQGEAARNLRASMLGHRPLPLVCQTCQARPVKHGESTAEPISKRTSLHSSISHTN